ncbi:hypothetical protein [Sandarakinorhabdus limnophila]|uniref:hypothetical protein n=1 Tax=Sandarakinorhabdus limnophila TaxID=210512 RepID=UPI0026F1BBC3|nr:hypothetical protein [Sandarakinorhabdus limnophila]
MRYLDAFRPDPCRKHFSPAQTFILGRHWRQDGAGWQIGQRRCSDGGAHLRKVDNQGRRTQPRLSALAGVIVEIRRTGRCRRQRERCRWRRLRRLLQGGWRRSGSGRRWQGLNGRNTNRTSRWKIGVASHLACPRLGQPQKHADSAADHQCADTKF